MSHHSIESLETRRLLAGNVTAEVVSGSLIITGDDAANDIIITGERFDRRALTISTTDGDTNINGDSAPVSFSDITRHVIIRLRGGDDSLEFRNAEVKYDLRISLGDGADLLQTADSLVRRDFGVHGDAGNDEILINSMRVAGRTGLAADDGRDQLIINAGSYKGAVRMLGGAGNDAIGKYGARFLTTPVILSGPGADQVDQPALTFHYDFDRGREGWHSGFADWRRVDKPKHTFVAEPADLPSEIGDGQGYLLSGDNRTDDLFMFLTKTISDLPFGPRYLVAFDIQFASNALTGGFGVGGSAGDSVFLKAGASSTKTPQTALDDQGIYRLNYDHGQQASGGKDVSLVGTIANGLTPDDVTDTENPPYRSISKSHVHPTVIDTQPGGTVQVIVGTDSGFEATTAVYYQRITVKLIPIQPAG